MRAMLQLQRSGMLPGGVGGGVGGGLPNPYLPPPPPTQGGAAPPPLDFSALLAGMGGGVGGGPSPSPLPPPADPAAAYVGQLQQLQDMGFVDRERNIQVDTHSYNIPSTRLLSFPTHPPTHPPTHLKYRPWLPPTGT